MTERVEDLLRDAELLVALLKDPQPGLSTWQEMVWKTRRRLMAGETGGVSAGAGVVPASLITALRNWSGAEPSQSVLAREVDAWLSASGKGER